MQRPFLLDESRTNAISATSSFERRGCRRLIINTVEDQELNKVEEATSSCADRDA
jgi:hypothetical protein